MSTLVAKPTARLVNAGIPDPGLSAQMPVRPPSEGDGSGNRTETALKRTQRIIRQGYEEAKSRGHVSFAHLDNGAGLDISAENTQGKHVTRFILLRSNRVVKKDFLLRVSMVWLQLRWSRRKNPQCISADTPSPSLPIRRGLDTPSLDQALSEVGSGFLSTPPRFAQNPQNAHDGTFFHHPAKEGVT